MSSNPSGMDTGMNNPSTDLPFLVTQYLASFAAAPRNAGSEEEKGGANSSHHAAIDCIRKATYDIAAAFADLGAFGVTLQTPIGESMPTQEDNDKKPPAIMRNANYLDLTRRWDGVSANQLESLVSSSSTATSAVLNNAKNEDVSILDLAYDRGKPSNTVQTSIQQQNTLGVNYDRDFVVPSAMQRPVLLERTDESLNGNVANNSLLESSKMEGIAGPMKTQLALGSDLKRIEILASQASKRYLSIREKFQEEKVVIRQIQRSLSYQTRLQSQLDDEAAILLATSCASAHSSSLNEVNDERRLKSDDLSQRKLENERVTAQLGRKFDELQTNHDTVSANELNMAQSVADALWKQCIIVEKSYLDPSSHGIGSFHKNCKIHGRKSDSIMNYVIGRGYGAQAQGRKGVLRQRIGGSDGNRAIMQRTKKMFLGRVCHVVTISAHLYCPVYCLRFDRTGRYFVCGADDNLVKVFRIGNAVNPESRERQLYHSLNPDFSFRRGAVLVCTLRGHAGVITDIDVSFDNALLATASEDGDVRVWGMTDGCPVAILRGHEGGANMVAWSVITPYQLATIAGDGLARVWDVREAALKRCKNVRSRRDYLVPLEEESNEDKVADESADDIILPPLPAPGQNGIQEEVNGHVDLDNAENGDVFVPPLPAGAEFGIGAEVVDANGNRIIAPTAGAFISNGEIDEGVSLLSRLQHGDLPENSQHQGAGTRSRRKKVKVICLSRCPIGGHFATGSDDGIGRIWLDDANDAIEKIDSQYDGDTDNGTILQQGQTRDSMQRTRSSSRGASNAPSTSSLLASLHGHHNEITDVKYSNMGDRLITASQKDGVVRIWSWGTEASKGLDGSVKIDQIRQIFIRMESPRHLKQQVSSATAQGSGPTSRRRGGNAAKQKSDIITQCDVAAWTADDSKVVTSQTSVTKSTDTDIIPGSHILYIWDSKSGDCLIGLPRAHDKLCPVLFTHPFDSTILVSAGADGSAKIWDLEAGKCIFSHLNLHNHGALENLTDRGKKCGYLDGSFSPDGLHLVLTDDSGRVTIIDVLGTEELASSCASQRALEGDSTRAPTWMQEQYFANDYYDLFYDANGYCIEKGSRKPPHLAPEAARCMHTGHAYADPIQLAFSGLDGPMPLSNDVVRMNRLSIRHKSTVVRKQGGILTQNVNGKRHLIEARPKEIALIGGSVNYPPSISSGTAVSGLLRRPTNRVMSSNYRWIGFEELEREGDDDDQDSDDEEYQEGNAATTSFLDDEPEQESLDPDDYQPREGRRRQRNRNSSQRSRRQQTRRRPRREVEELEEVRRHEPTRASSRQISRRNDSQYVNLSDESDIEEMLSANTAPVGEYTTDYTVRGHIYKLPNGASVNRKWLTRVNSVLGYTGWKTYCPQVGDQVVYIPRAHSEILKAFPICESSSGAPWKSWPKINPWPMVQCEVKNIRHRFPFNGYFGSRARTPICSVVAILTLEITGIPIHDQERSVPWARAEFIPRPSTRSSSSTFDVSIFENGETDFILPLELYKWKVQSLESVIDEQGIGSGVELTDFFVNSDAEDSRFDPFLCDLYTTIPDAEREIHFQGSGYCNVNIKYEGTDESYANTWDVTVRGKEGRCPLPTCLTNEQTKAILGIVDSLESDTHLKAIFSAPVDTRMFVDYNQMIEVPMDISLIRRRLNQQYYTNVYSVLADVKLIRDNCYKYNKMGSEITSDAKKVYDTFKASFEEKVRIIGHEPCAREKSIELDAAVRIITSNRRSSRLRDPQGAIDADQSVDLDRDENSSRITRRVDQRDNRTSGSANRAVSNRSLRANARSGREEEVARIDAPRDAPRIRISMRRTQLQQEYISEEGSSSEEDVSLEADGRIINANLKVLVNGTEYDDLSEVGNDGEESHTDHDRPKRKAAKQYLSSSEEDFEVEKEPARMSSRRSTRASTKMPSTESDQETEDIVSKRQNTRRATRRLDIAPQEDESSEEEIQVDDSVHETAGRDKRRSGRNQISNTSKAKEESEEEETSEDDAVGRPTRAAASKKRGDKSETSEESEEEYTSAGDTDGRPTRTATRNQRGNTSKRREDSEEEHTSEDDIVDRPRRVATRNQRSNRPQTAAVVHTRGNPTASRSTGQTQVESLQETFNRRRTARSSHSRQDNTEQQQDAPGVGRRTRRSTTRPSSLENLPVSSPVSPGATRSSSRRRAVVGQYHDLSETEIFEAESESEEESEEETAPNTTARRKRPRATSARKPVSPKKRPKKPKRSLEVSLPKLDKWPGHMVKADMMEEVCNEIITRVETFDAEELFHTPVVEKFPDVAEKYYEKVSHPIDLRTIREERVPYYRVISELQDDLILVFQNCCTFNRVNSQYWKYSVEIWENLNEIFVSALTDLGIDIPRRFNK